LIELTTFCVLGRRTYPNCDSYNDQLLVPCTLFTVG